jgi:glycosyltransferase involved in cell wall biosynthesis
MNPKISIILPTYNRANLLKQRIKEFQIQLFEDWELIIVDDASTDNTEDVIKSIQDSRISYIKLNKNSHNVSIPRNIGITKAKGIYIFNADDDDIHHKDALSALVSILDSNPTAILAYGDRFVVQNEIKQVVRKPEWNPLAPNGWGVGNGQFMYRKLAYETIPLVFSKRACDWRLCSELYKLGKFIYTPKVILTVIWHTNNRSLDESTKKTKIDIAYYNQYFTNFNILEIEKA